MPPGPEREAVLARTIEDLEGKASRLDEKAEQLRELVLRHDPGQLIPSVAVPALMGIADPFANPSAPDDVTRTFGTEAKIEYLIGLALSGPPGSVDVDKPVTTKAIQLIAEVFESAQAKTMLQGRPIGKSTDWDLNAASFLFRFERLLDRMAGYELHLDEIAEAVFEPHREFYRGELGFCPSDLIKLVRRHVAWCNLEFNDSYEAIHGCMNSTRVDDDIASREVHRFHRALEVRYIWSPELLVTSTNFPESDICNALDKMSVEFGCQPEYLTPLDNNKARWYPAIRLSEHKYLVPDPWAIVHGLHNWLQDYIQVHSITKLQKRYPDHRSEGAESLVSRSLKDIFGDQVVHTGQHYDCSEGHGEIDSLVASSTPVVVEVKSRSLTEQGRKGLINRIRTVVRDVLDKSFEQTQRACTYLMQDGGRHFSDKQGGKPICLLPDRINSPIEIVVTMERMDPLALAAKELANDDQVKGAWVTNLPDFLMVRDILGDPASFMHYARIRGEASGMGRLRFFMESDVLETYLNDRLVTLLDEGANTEDGGQLVLDYNSGTINSFFMFLGTDFETEKPSPCVPTPIVESLRECSSDYSETWVTVATSVMESKKDQWRAWNRFLHRHRGERVFHLPDEKAGIVVSATVIQAELRSDPIPTLVIPRSKLGL